MSEESELHAAIEKIIQSTSRNKLIVSGPGTGKTSLFKKLLEISPRNPEKKLVLTFINTLKNDLEKALSEYSNVYTLHSFCLRLLHENSSIRNRLPSDFECFPGLETLIIEDWEIINKTESPHFIREMRKLDIHDYLEFYIERGNYYHGVDFDDTVYRTLDSIRSGRFEFENYELILVDEFQDFNRMEASIIEALSTKSPIVLAGDDDQALYSQLRDSSWDYIRGLCLSGKYEVFELPYCLRCPKVIVEAINDIIEQAKRLMKLQGRIEKPFKYFPLVKEADSIHYPKIDYVKTSVQRQQANYMGRYIEQIIQSIPKEEIDDAIINNYPAVLIIVNKPYRDQIATYLLEKGIVLDQREDTNIHVSRLRGLNLLKVNNNSNIGWRIILRDEPDVIRNEIINKTKDRSINLVEIIPDEIKHRVLSEVEILGAPIAEKEEKTAKEKIIPVRITSFEGAKGLSAQHVIIAGLHNNELPRDINNIKDMEICKVIVGLSRTRKKCSIITTSNFANQPRQPSVFIDWIKKIRLDQKIIDAKYWKSQR